MNISNKPILISALFLSISMNLTSISGKAIDIIFDTGNYAADESDDTEYILNEINPHNFLTASYIMDSESIIVYDFDGFKSALSKDNDYVNIYLGADINMNPQGIEISSSKKSVMISGMNPLDGSGPYRINEYNSLDIGYTIRVPLANKNTKEITVRDINITGRNYYGTICVYDGVSDVTVIFENVNYNGPQISYNRAGTLRIIGSSYINIKEGNGLSVPQELAEVKALELGGNIVIDHYSPTLTGVWLVGKNSYIKILPDANIVWNENGKYMIFQDNSQPAELIVEKNSKLIINTINGLFFNTDLVYHQFGDVFIDSGGTLEIMQQGSNPSNNPILKIKHSLHASDNANLIIIAEKAPQLLYMTGAADITIESPDTMVLYNKNNKLIKWSGINSHNISILSGFINYWNNPCDLEVLGSFEDDPLHRWRKKNGEDLSVQINASSNATKSVSSNYTDYDYGIAPSTESLDMQSSRILVAGKLLLQLDNVTEASSYISGKTEPNAELYAVYTDNKKVIHKVYGQADAEGIFNIAIEKANPPLLDSTVEVYSSIGYKNVFESTVVTQSSTDLQMLIHVPKYLTFPETIIEAKRKLIYREDIDWHIVIEDNRKQGSEWTLYARLMSPLSGEIKDMAYPLDDAIIFLDSRGEKAVLNNTAIKIASGVNSGETEAYIKWPVDKGIVLDVDTSKVYADINYSARIEWSLVDGP